MLVECLALWIDNLLLDSAGRPGLLDAEILVDADALAETARTVAGRVIVVSSEVGCGIITRAFAGPAFRQLAR